MVLSDIRKGTTVKSLCANVSTQLLRDFNYALVWGMSAKHSPQRCGLSHKLDGKINCSNSWRDLEFLTAFPVPPLERRGCCPNCEQDNKATTTRQKLWCTSTAISRQALEEEAGGKKEEATTSSGLSSSHTKLHALSIQPFCSLDQRRHLE